MEAELRTAQEDLAAGSAISRTGAGDTMTESRLDKSPDTRVKILLKALNKLDPDRYPIADVSPIDRVRVRFDYCVTVPFP